MGIKNRKPTLEALSMLGANVKRLRRARGLTQVALSRITGLPNKYISCIEHGKKNATVANIEAIAKGLECLMRELFTPIGQEHGPGRTEVNQSGRYRSIYDQSETHP